LGPAARAGAYLPVRRAVKLLYYCFVAQPDRLVMTTAAAGAAQVPACQQPGLPFHSTWAKELVCCVSACANCAGGCAVWQPRASIVASSSARRCSSGIAAARMSAVAMAQQL
jgi:hypothetical protein